MTTVTVFENQHSIHSFDGKNRSNRIFKNIFTRKSFRVRQKEVGLLFGLASSTAKKSVVLRIIQLTTFNLQAKIAVEIRITLVILALLNRLHSASFGDSQELWAKGLRVETFTAPQLLATSLNNTWLEKWKQQKRGISEIFEFQCNLTNNFVQDFFAFSGRDSCVKRRTSMAIKVPKSRPKL